MWLLLTCPSLGTWPATQACALTGNRTRDPLVHRLALNPLSHTSQGLSKFLKKRSLDKLPQNSPECCRANRIGKDPKKSKQFHHGSEIVRNLRLLGASWLVSQKSLEGLHEGQHTITIWPSSSALKNTPERGERESPHKHFCTNVHGSTIHNIPKRPSADEQTHRMRYSHVVEYYSAVKKHHLLIHTVWTHFENILLMSERSQPPEATNGRMPFI